MKKHPEGLCRKEINDIVRKCPAIEKKRKRDVFMGNLDNRPFGWMSFKAKYGNISTWARKVINKMLQSNAIYQKQEGVNIVCDKKYNRYYYILERCAVYKNAKEEYLYKDSLPPEGPKKDLCIITHPDENEHIFLVCRLKDQAYKLDELFHNNNRQTESDNSEEKQKKQRNYWIFYKKKMESQYYLTLNERDDNFNIIEKGKYQLVCLTISEEDFYTSVRNGEDIYETAKGK